MRWYDVRGSTCTPAKTSSSGSTAAPLPPRRLPGSGRHHCRQGRSPIRSLSPANNWYEQNPGDWWRSACAALRELFQQVSPAAVAAIAISNQRETFVPLAQDGDPVRPAIVWLDQRCEEEVAWLADRVGREKSIGSRASLPTWRPSPTESRGCCGTSQSCFAARDVRRRACVPGVAAHRRFPNELGKRGPAGPLRHAAKTGRRKCCRAGTVCGTIAAADPREPSLAPSVNGCHCDRVFPRHAGGRRWR